MNDDATHDDATTAPDAVAHLAAAAAALLAAEVTDAVDLGGSERSTVARLTLADGRTVVAKQYGTGGGHRHEQLGLAHLHATPDLLASDDDARLIVMSDVGTGATLADLLLGTDREAALEGAISWAAALGDLTGRTVSDADSLRAQVPEDPMFNAATVVRGAVVELADLTGATLDTEADLIAIERLFAPSAHDVLWPSDTCPDNAILGPHGWTFLDLEGTSVSHAALVAAYTSMPFATCWCVLDPPAGFTAAMTTAFTAALGAWAPGIAERAEWEREVLLAGATWSLANTAWLLPRAHDGDGPIGPSDRLSPTRRQLLTGRWRWMAASLTQAAPSLAELGASAVVWAEREWGDGLAVGPYPAFAGD